MIISVVPDLVTFVDDAPNEARIFLRVHAHEKERRLHVRRFQNVENLRRPSRIGTVVESDRDLMLAARALMIERRKFGNFVYLRGQITVCVHGELSHSVRAILVNSDDFAVADVRDRVGAMV